MTRKRSLLIVILLVASVLQGLLPIPIAMGSSLTVSISHSYDDVWMTEAGNIFSNTFMVMMLDNEIGIHSFLRFQGLEISKTAKINYATLKVYVAETQETPDPGSSVTIYGIDEPDCTPFTSDGSLWSLSRPYTSASVNWNTTVWAGYQSVNVTDIVKEIINQYAWSSGNDLGLQILGASDSGQWPRSFEDYYHAYHEGQAELTIVYDVVDEEDPPEEEYDLIEQYGPYTIWRDNGTLDLTGWPYRKSHNITGSVGAGTDYQVNITVHGGYGTDSPWDVYLNGSGIGDFSDIRFTDDDGETELDYLLFEGVFNTGQEVVSDDGRGIYASPYVTRPASWYLNGKTYFVFMDQAWDPNIIYYDHSSNTFSSPVQIANSPINDDHSYPMMLIDSSGYIHVFYGCHATPLKYRRSTNPEDISSWDVMGDLFAKSTYPMGLIRDSVLYVFFRNDIGGGYPYHMGFITSDDGGDSWSGVTNLIIGGVGHVASPIAVTQDSTGLIHMLWRRFDGANFINLYHAYYDPDTGKCYEMDGTDLGADISEAEADSNCRLAVIASVSSYGDIVVDSNDYPLILHNREGDYIKTYHWNGLSWDVATVTSEGFGCGSFAYYNDSDVRLFTNVLTNGLSDIREYRTTNLGTSWTCITDISKNDPEKNYFPNVPVNFIDDIKIWWGRGESTPSDIMAYGDDTVPISCAVFWVKIDDDLDSNVTIYIYYGRSGVTTTSDGNTTFPWLFDDFEDYSINDAPNAVDWNTTGTGGGDTILVKADPADAERKAFEIVETGDVTYTILWGLLKDYRPDYAFHFRTRGDTDTVWAFWGYEDEDIRKAVRRDGAINKYQHHNGVGYVDFNPVLVETPVNTWTEIVEKVMDTGASFLNWNVDGVEYVGDMFNASLVGINLLDFHPDRTVAQTVYIGGVGNFSRYVFARKFTEDEPAHEDWGELEEETEDEFFITDENGTVISTNGNFTNQDDLEDWIDDNLLNGGDPLDPDPGTQGWDTEGPWTRFKTRLYFLFIGLACVFTPLWAMAYRKFDSVGYAWCFLIMVLGVGLLWSITGI